MKPVNELVDTVQEATEASMAFLRETRNGTANVEQAHLGAKLAQRVFTGVSTNVKTRLAAPRLAEIENSKGPVEVKSKAA